MQLAGLGAALLLTVRVPVVCMMLHSALVCSSRVSAVGMMSHQRCACSRCNKLSLHCNNTILMGGQASLAVFNT